MADLYHRLVTCVEEAADFDSAVSAVRSILWPDEAKRTADKQPETLVEWSVAHIERMKHLGRSPRTIDGYAVLLEELKQWFPKLRPAECNAFALNAYKRRLEEKGNVHATISKKFDRLKALLDFVKPQAQVSGDIEFFKLAPVEHAAKEWLTVDEVERLRDWHRAANKSTPKAKAAACLLTGIMTGLRASDLAKVRAANIEEVMTKEGKPFKRLVLRASKTGRLTLIALPDELLEVLEPYGFDLPAFGTSTLNDLLKEVAKACGINKHVTTHVGRNTFASLLLLKGTPPERIREALGHTNVEQTLSYCKSLKGLADDDRLSLLTKC